MLLGGRVQPARVFPLLMLGAALLGGGLVAASMATSLVVLAIPFGCAAVGAGLVTALGFPYFARFIPVGESGSYSGLFFSVRAVAATVAVPMAGVVIELTGSYRGLMAQGAFALLALVPLALARVSERGARRAEPRPVPARVAAVVPCHNTEGAAAVVQAALPYVDEVVLVDDGTPEEDAAVLATIGDWPRRAPGAPGRERGQGRRRRRGCGRAAGGARPAGRPDRGGRRRPAPAGPDPRVRGRSRARRHRDRRPARGQGLDAVDAPLHERHLDRAAHPRHGPADARLAVRDAPLPRRLPGACAAAARALRGRDQAPAHRAAAWAERRVGADPGDLPRGAQLVQAARRHRARARLDRRPAAPAAAARDSDLGVRPPLGDAVRATGRRDARVSASRCRCCSRSTSASSSR